MSILAMEEEISNQAQDLPRFASHLRREHSRKLERSSFVFAGSGDSYAAAVFAQELSHGEAVASDPYELLTNVQRIRGKNLVIVSVSGRTRTNFELARKTRRIAAKRIAITANDKSPLAEECDEILQLKYRNAGILTSGTVSFATSILACAFLLGSLPRTVQVQTGLTEIVHLTTSLKRALVGTFLFTGSGVNYALALYGAAKINEVLGMKAEAMYPEELGHAKLFTIDKKRDAIVCIPFGRDKTMKTHELLRKKGFQSSILAPPERNLVNRSLKTAIYLQRLALSLAKRSGIKECAFLTDRNRLRLSNRMIY
jgi:fructoselysine-6-P-deglycase FrlB-like protein